MGFLKLYQCSIQNPGFRFDFEAPETSFHFQNRFDHYYSLDVSHIFSQGGVYM